MIGKQINFYLTASDHQALLSLVNDAVGLAIITRDDETNYCSRDVFEKKADDWAVAYVTQPSARNEVLSKLLSGVEDSTELLAIEFIQSTESNGVISRGRFWYSSATYIGGVKVRKPDSFVIWADSVLSVTRRHLARFANGDYIGSQASSKLKDGLLKADR